MGEVIEFFKVVGVPGGIAVFVLWRLDKRFEQLVDEFRKFREAVQESFEDVEDLEKHVSTEADRVIREVTHDVRAALGNHMARKV